MKLISAQTTLLFFSLILGLTAFLSCRIDSKKELSLDRARELDKESIIQLLDNAKNQIINNDLEGAIVTLDSIINGYGTYEEVEEAYQLKKEAETRYTLNKILTLHDIGSILSYLTDHDILEIRIEAENRIKDLITSTEDPQVIQDFLNSKTLPHLQTMAMERQRGLLKQKEEQLYAEATRLNNARTWKNFIKMYPEHSNRHQIEDNIIKLEVDEIFKGSYGEIPPSIQKGVKNYVSSAITITNNTSYTLTLRYSGPENRKLIISPGATDNLQLKSGEYRVTASVNAARVSNYAGWESLNGNYSSSYYISN